MVLAVALAAGALGQETTLESRIVSVGMFKNGLATVKRAVTVQAAGTYLVSDVPEPVHGTFWIESDAKVETRVISREVELNGTGADVRKAVMQGKLAVHFGDKDIPAISGTAVAAKADPTAARAWDRSYEGRDRWGYYRPRQANAPAQANGQPTFLVLKTDDGITYVDFSLIAYAQVGARQGKAGAVISGNQLRAAFGPPKRKRQTVLLLDVGEIEVLKKPATILITDLTKGIAWAPSYRVDISDPDELQMAQKAVIKNELEDLKDVELYLITGFPSVEFAHVTSPLSHTTTWTSFFQQLRRQPGRYGGQSYAMTQQRVMFNRAAPSTGALDLSAIPEGQGPDLHYQPLGVHSMAEGDSLAITVADGKASYERIVEWTVPDARNPDGRHVSNADKSQGDAWDALRFRNPLPFPMTTGPAMTVADGRLLGQRMSYFVNKGEQTTLQITKALSVRTRSTEYEEPRPGDRETFRYGGRTYYKVPVTGELTVNNHRAEKVKLIIRRQFSGELSEADGNPRCILREEGVYSVNKRNQLIWTVDLNAGQEKKLTYRYVVLVRH